MKQITAVTALIGIILMAGIAQALGIVTYYDSSPILIPMSETRSLHFYYFEIQNANEGSKEISIKIIAGNDIAYLEKNEFKINAYSSTKIPIAVKLTKGLDYRAGDYEDIMFYVTEKINMVGTNTAIKKGLSSDFRVILGNSGQEAKRNIRDVPEKSESENLPEEDSYIWYGGEYNDTYFPPLEITETYNRNLPENNTENTTEEIPSINEQKASITGQIIQATNPINIIIIIIFISATIFLAYEELLGK